MAYTISFLWPVELNLCHGVRSLHCQLGDKPSLSIDSGLQAMGLGPRDVERATEVTRVVLAEGFQPIGTPPRHLRANSWKGNRAASKESDSSGCPDGCGAVLAAVKTWRRREGRLLGSRWLFMTSFLRTPNTCRRCPVCFGQKNPVILQDVEETRADIALR